MVIDFIKDLVNKNMAWINIKSMLRLDKQTLVRLVGDAETREVPVALLINYQHVYYRINKLLEKRAKLDGDLDVSLAKWGSKVNNEQEPIHGYWEYENLSQFQDGAFFVAFMSEWQLGRLRHDGDLVCLDSTHKTCVDGNGAFCFLYTLVVRCSVTGKGKPVAWMLTNSEKHLPILRWLLWLKESFGFIPTRIMIDNSDIEISAVNQAFNRLQEDKTYTSDVQILICQWHILKAWKGKILTKLVPKTGGGRAIKSASQKKEMRAKALEMMLDIMQVPNAGEFREALHDFRDWCTSNEAEWDCSSLYWYFESYYLPKKENWCKAWRQGNYRIETNNYIETWHRHLKEVYLATIKKQRLDVLVYLLWDVVLPDFMQDHIKYNVGVSNKVMNEAERMRIQRANAIDDVEAEDMIFDEQLDSLKVKSFTVDDTHYDLQIDITKIAL